MRSEFKANLRYIVYGIVGGILGGLFMLSLGCTPARYRICDATTCSAPMTHEEAIKAHEVQDAWKDTSHLRVTINPGK